MDSGSSAVSVRASSSYNRRRAGNACLVCRSRKTKCDNQRPVCGFCAATGGTCRYVDSDPSQFDRASLAILQRLGQMESNIIKHFDISLKQQKNSLSVSHDSGASNRESMDRNDMTEMQGFDDHLTNLQQNEQIITAPTGSGSLHIWEEGNMPPNGEMLLSSSDMSMDSILRWPLFSEAVPHLKKALETPTIERVELKGQYEDRAKLGTTILNLDSQVINDLVENFLVNNHIKNPILDCESLRSDAREFAETGPQWDGKSCLILLVCAISSLSAPLEAELHAGSSKDTYRLSLAEAYFQASQRRIGMLYHENSIIAAQCSFLTAVYLMATLQILAAWKCFVQAGSQCLGWMKSQGRPNRHESLNQNADASSEANLAQNQQSVNERHMEESLYWSCLKSEIEVRFELGMPGSGLCEMDYPHLFPSPPTNTMDDENMSPCASSEASWTPSSKSIADKLILEKSWYFYLAEIALKRMIHNVIIQRFRLKSPRDQSQVRFRLGKGLEELVNEYDNQVEKWYETLPSLMVFSKQADIFTSDILKVILRGHMIDIRLATRFPVIQAILAGDVPLSRLSEIHQKFAREYLQSAADCLDSNRPTFYHRHQGTWLMIRSCTRSALQILGVAMECHTQSATKDQRKDLEQKYLPLRWNRLLGEFCTVLEYWADENNDLNVINGLFKELLRVYELSLHPG